VNIESGQWTIGTGTNASSRFPMFNLEVAVTICHFSNFYNDGYKICNASLHLALVTMVAFGNLVITSGRADE